MLDNIAVSILVYPLVIAWLGVFINPKRIGAARDTVFGLFVCVCLSLANLVALFHLSN